MGNAVQRFVRRSRRAYSVEVFTYVIQTSVTASAFKSKALPLHINITHTPPAITEEGDGKVTATAADPGHITSASLLPAVFSTGSYGWKGNQRVTVEVENEKGEKEKLQVQIR